MYIEFSGSMVFEVKRSWFSLPRCLQRKRPSSCVSRHARKERYTGCPKRWYTADFHYTLQSQSVTCCVASSSKHLLLNIMIPRSLNVIERFWFCGHFLKTGQWRRCNGSPYTYCPPPPKKKKKKNRNVSINSFQNCGLIWIYCRIIFFNTNYLHLGETPIWFGSVVTKK